MAGTHSCHSALKVEKECLLTSGDCFSSQPMLRHNITEHARRSHNTHWSDICGPRVDIHGCTASTEN